MDNPEVRFARLNKEKMAKLYELEQELGTYVLAFEPVMKVATLDPEQLKKLKAVEDELGVILVAYKDPE